MKVSHNVCKRKRGKKALLAKRERELKHPFGFTIDTNTFKKLSTGLLTAGAILKEYQQY